MDSFSSPMSASSIRTPTTSFGFDKMALTTPNYRIALREGTNGLPLSPPISPYESQQKEDDERMDEDTVRDPPLFPSQDSRAQSASDAPLFDQDTAISQHLATTSTLPERTPAREDYKLFVSCVLEKFSKDPWAWAAREREFAKQYGPPGKVTKQKLKPRRLAPAPLATVRRVNKTAGSVPRMPRVSRPVKRTPPTKVFDTFMFEPVTASSPKTPRPQTNRDDVDYQSLPDYSPSPETLSKGNNKVLKADWKGQPLDLSDDKDRHLLHEAEVNLAATLRLTCATYLCSKRRIFMARIETLRIGKEFRKTDAQQACKIDVNKASKLWSAFEKVGWFRKELFEQYA